MAKKLSTGLRNALLGLNPSVVAQTTVSFTSSTKTIADSGNGLGGFQPGDYILLAGGSGNNLGLKTVVTVNVAGSSLTVSETIDDASAGDSITITLLNGRSLASIFKNAILEIYSGAQPADADQAETGTKLLRISLASGSFVPGVATNGLNWGTPSSGALAKASEVWSGVGLAAGVAGWFRLYSNLYITGASTTVPRIDGSVGTSGAQLNLSTTTIVLGATTTIDTFTISLAA